MIEKYNSFSNLSKPNAVVDVLCERDKNLCDSVTRELRVFLPHMSESKLSLVVGATIVDYKNSHLDFREGEDCNVVNGIILNPIIRSGIKAAIYEKLDEWMSISYVEMIETMSSCFCNEAIMEPIIAEMIEAKLIDMRDGFIKKKVERPNL